MKNEEIQKLKADISRYRYNEYQSSNLKLIFKSLTNLGFWALLNFRIGKYLRESFNLKIVKLITGINKVIIEIITGISIPYSCEIGGGLLIGHFSGIMIGSNVEIGENCTLHQNVTIGAAGRDEKRGEPQIGNNVFIGAGAVVLGKISIGNNVAIGANAVVVDNISSNAVVVSEKSKVINYKGTKSL